MLTVILIILILLFLGGGFGASFGGWEEALTEAMVTEASALAPSC